MSWLLQDLRAWGRCKHMEKGDLIGLFRVQPPGKKGGTPLGPLTQISPLHVYTSGVVCGAFSSDPGWSSPARGWDELPSPQGSASIASGTSHRHKTLRASLPALSSYPYRISPQFPKHFKLQQHFPLAVPISEIYQPRQAGQKGDPYPRRVGPSRTRCQSDP